MINSAMEIIGDVDCACHEGTISYRDKLLNCLGRMNTTLGGEGGEDDEELVENQWYKKDDANEGAFDHFLENSRFEDLT